MQILPGGEATFFLLFGLFLGLFAVRSALRLITVLRLVRRGEHADGWCAERRVRDRGPGSERAYATEYVFAFRTPGPDGREIRFTDHAPGPFGFEVGAPVRVSYDPKAPEKHATVAGPGAWGPLLAPAGFTAVLSVLTLVLLYGFVAIRGWV